MAKIFVRRGKGNHPSNSTGVDSTAAEAASTVEPQQSDVDESQPVSEQGVTDSAEGEEELTNEEELDFAEELAPQVSSRVEADPSAIEKLELEVKEYLDKYLRAVAEHENFKRRAAKERSDLLKYSGEYVLRDLLDVVDNLERALSQEVPAGAESVHEGVRMVLMNFLATLDRHGIRANSGKGKPFNPVEQEALATVPTPGVEPGTVIDEYRKAYHYKDKLLRPGQVVVAAAMPAEADRGTAEEQ